MVHGRWTLLEPDRAEYLSERLLPPGQAKAHTGLPDFEGYPEISARFTLQNVYNAISLMRQAQAYLDANLDLWEDHFGVEYDMDFMAEESARIGALKRRR